jgi:hypothetical protein
VAKQQNLDLLLVLRTPAEHHQLEQLPQRPVHNRQNDPRERPNTVAGPIGQTASLRQSRRELATRVFGPHTLTEGVTLLVPGIQNFNHSAGGDNVYIQIS